MRGGGDEGARIGNMVERLLTCNECCCKELGRVQLTTLPSEKGLEVCISREIDARECDVS